MDSKQDYVEWVDGFLETKGIPSSLYPHLACKNLLAPFARKVSCGRGAQHSYTAMPSYPRIGSCCNLYSKNGLRAG